MRISNRYFNIIYHVFLFNVMEQSGSGWIRNILTDPDLHDNLCPASGTATEDEYRLLLVLSAVLRIRIRIAIILKVGSGASVKLVVTAVKMALVELARTGGGWSNGVSPERILGFLESLSFH